VKGVYGESGNEQQKSSADFVYEITLESFTNVKEKWGMEASEKREQSLKRKTEGNEYFNSSHFSHALKKYKAALDFVEDDSKIESEEKKNINQEICLPCHLNSAMCHIKLKNYRKAIEATEKALLIDSNNVKGIWRRGLARQELGLWDEAKIDFIQCTTLEPENKAVKQSLEKLKVMMKKYDEQDAARYKKLFT